MSKKYKIIKKRYNVNGQVESIEEIKIPNQYEHDDIFFKDNFESWLRGINVPKKLDIIEKSINKTGTFSYKYQVGNPQYGGPWTDVIIEITNNIKEKQRIINKKLKKIKNVITTKRIRI